MTTLCTICARGGSKGVPGKNIRPLLGRPLIAWSIMQAREASVFDMIAVSSDSKAILEAAGAAGADLMIERPAKLASDRAGKLPAIRHAIEQAEIALGRPADTLVDLDATSPLRNSADITGCIDLLKKSQASNVITGSPARRSPYFNLVELQENGTVTLSKPQQDQIKRRQDSPHCYDMNASIYVWRRDVFMAEPRVFYEDTRLFEMPEERSIDVDSELDFAFVELLMQAKLGAAL